MKRWKNISIVKVKADEIDESKLFWKTSVSTDLFVSESYAVWIKHRISCYFLVSVHGVYANVSLMFNRLLFNAKLTQAICAYIFEQWPSCRKIAIYLLESDWYGCYLARAAGFSEEVVFRKHYRIDGQKMNCIVFSVVKG
ncbi:hypothetical protein [Paenibacillus sp. GCM10012306]|uniref:hypothetical protein n=1 Tax=Paenibacillus sp. GCM10012306 TaxID=3317342 RepID=UPI0036100D32